MARETNEPETSTPPVGPPTRVRLIGQLICRIALHAPGLWPLIRRPVGSYFGRLAGDWSERTQAGGPEHLATLARAALRVRPAPERILDLGCGSGETTLFLAREFPQARIRGLDLSPAMIAQAQARVGLDPQGRIAFKVGDASHLAYEADSFDLITQVNVPVFARELTRVLRPGGQLIVCSTIGADTPFHTSPISLTRALGRLGFETVELGEAGRGSFYVGRLSASGEAPPGRAPQ